MDKDKDLLPCPFCGCEDIDEYEGDYGNGVYCMMCGAMMGEPIHMEFRTDERVTYEQAAEAWNTRTPEHAIAATLGSEREAELQKALNKAAGNWARADAELRKALDFMRIWISDDAHLGESAISREFEKAEGLRKLDAIERAIAATLCRPKAKSHPYGYECDTGAYDATRCECGCINDISAAYCNDCGGEIEIDESAEKECYDGYSKHMVFAKKHDDGSLEFCERRYVPEVSATHGTLTAEQVREAAKSKSRQYESPVDDGVWITEYDWNAIADELNATLGGGECEQVLVDCDDGLMPPFTAYCSKCGKQWGFTPKFCPECGARVAGTRDERKWVKR